MYAEITHHAKNKRMFENILSYRLVGDLFCACLILNKKKEIQFNGELCCLQVWFCMIVTCISYRHEHSAPSLSRDVNGRPPVQGQSSPVQVEDPYTGSILVHVGSFCNHTRVYKVIVRLSIMRKTIIIS